MKRGDTVKLKGGGGRKGRLTTRSIFDRTVWCVEWHNTNYTTEEREAVLAAIVTKLPARKGPHSATASASLPNRKGPQRETIMRRTGTR